MEKKLTVCFEKYAGRKGCVICAYGDDDITKTLTFGTGAECFEESFRQLGNFIDKNASIDSKIHSVV